MIHLSLLLFTKFGNCMKLFLLCKLVDKINTAKCHVWVRGLQCLTELRLKIGLRNVNMLYEKR